MPVKPDKQALLDGVKAAYTQAKQNADAAAAAAEDVANAMKQLEDDEELALLRTDNKAAINALKAEGAKNALNMLHPDTLDTAAAPMGNIKVMPTDILPLALCDQDWVNEMKNVTMADGRPYLTIYKHDQLVCTRSTSSAVCSLHRATDRACRCRIGALLHVVDHLALPRVPGPACGERDAVEGPSIHIRPPSHHTTTLFTLWVFMPSSPAVCRGPTRTQRVPKGETTLCGEPDVASP